MIQPRIQPPGRCQRVEATSALVLAPHYDDEVLGCGGLLLQLVRAGAQVRVLYLTDSGADSRAAATETAPAAYIAERRAEAERVAARLGVAGCEHLGLPDGHLVHHLAAAADAIAAALVRHRPELVLVPSPLEVSPDHQATFAALHRVLGGLRPSESGAADAGDFAAVTANLRVLAYEVNRPLYPDLLVDISGELAELEALVALYPSQLARHAYWRACLGLSRFRTLSLPAEVEAAEAYRQLAPEDFACRSPAQLIATLGGVPELASVREGPLVSVVVRTLDRPQLLGEALASLAASTYSRAEVVLVNDGGRPPVVPGDFPLPVRRVDLPQTGGRARAAQAGVEAASGSHVAFLDDDDLVAPEHLATLAGLVGGAGIEVAYTDAAVGVYAPDGEKGWKAVERRLPYSRDFDPDLLLLDNYIPFNTLIVARPLLARVGPFDPELPFFEDWDLLIRLARLVPFHHLRQVTCEYRHFRGAGHHILGDAPRSRGDFLRLKAAVLAKHADFLRPERLAAAIDRLREELVVVAEERSAVRREAREWVERHATAVRERFAGEERYHRLNGELAGVRQGLDDAKSELERLYVEEERLTHDLGRQTELVGRLYTEIARQKEQIEAMEGTRAWRFHQWWQRRFR